jgi:hypothetical protein
VHSTWSLAPHSLTTPSVLAGNFFAPNDLKNDVTRAIWR